MRRQDEGGREGGKEEGGEDLCRATVAIAGAMREGRRVGDGAASGTTGAGPGADAVEG